MFCLEIGGLTYSRCSKFIAVILTVMIQIINKIKVYTSSVQSNKLT